MSFFRSLTRGVKFNKDRFLDDALRLGVAPKQPLTPTEVPTSKWDTAEANLPKAGKTGKRKRDGGDPEEDGIPIFKRDEMGGTQHGRIQKKTKKVPRDEKQEHEEKIRALRRSLSIFVSGCDVPPPLQDFAFPQVTDWMLANIRSCGYEVPTPVQMQTFPILMQGRELLASAPTGSGKSAAFLIPTILLLGESRRVVRAVVVSPTKELAGQIHRECVRLAEGSGLRILNLAAKKNNQNFKSDILITTPNRLVYALKEGKLGLEAVRLLVVDECDNLFDQGFQEQLGFIYSACAQSPDLRCAFFSATCAHQVDEFCRTHLHSHVVLSVGAKNSAVDQIDQSLVFVGTESGKLLELRRMLREGIQPPLLIFVQSQERAEELFAELACESVHCGIIHSGRGEGQRAQTIESFRVGKTWVLICTALMSRGMDFPAVRTVLNYDMPASHVAYIHAVGRTGRAGRTGKAVTFFTEEDRQNLSRIAQVLRNSGFPVPPFVFRLKRARRGEARAPKRKHISRKALELKEAARKKKWRWGKKILKQKANSSESPTTST